MVRLSFHLEEMWKDYWKVLVSRCRRYMEILTKTPIQSIVNAWYLSAASC